MSILTRISPALIGVGAGIVIVSNLVSFHPALVHAQLAMCWIGLALTGAGVLLGIYSHFSFAHKLFPSSAHKAFCLYTELKRAH